MPNTAFQNKWEGIAKQWELRVEIPFVVEVAGHQITVPVLLRDFGARLGILLVTDFNLISEYVNELVELGYGYSCLSEPSGPAHPEEDEALMEMLVDWGWSGNGKPPEWYRESASEQGDAGGRRFEAPLITKPSAGNEMKKRILQSLAILAVNIAIGGLALVSFFLFLFREDPILAAVPAVIALPGILLQPWFIAFFLLPGGPLLAPVLTTAVSVPLYVLLDRRGKLDRAKLVLSRIKTRRTLLVASTIAVVLVFAAFARYLDFPAMHRGIPRTLQYSTKDMNLVLGSPRYYCLGSFIDSEWLWQARLPGQDVDALADKLRLYPIASDQVGDHYRNMPPYWWRPVISDRVRVLATTNFPMEGRGPDGWHALATWNPEDEVLHMWIKDNF